MAEERLQKILARAGVASRRKAENLISAGRVRVDGQVVTELGFKANPRRSRVELDGERLEPEPLCYGVLHKPRAMVTTLHDPEGRPTAYDILKQVGFRVVPVGRLDFNTSGALLFTNDGDFAQALTHAKGNAKKVYSAKVQQLVDEAKLERWSQAIEIEGKMTRPAKVRILRRDGDKTWLEITLGEGKNRQVRRLGEHAKTPVVRLARLSHADITTEGLRPGQWRFLTMDELKSLKKQFGVPERVRPAPEPPTAAQRRTKASKRRATQSPKTSGPTSGNQRGGVGRASAQSRSTTAQGSKPGDGGAQTPRDGRRGRSLNGRTTRKRRG